MPGRDHLAGGERRSADDAVDLLRDRLLVSDPVLDGSHRPGCERVRGRRDRRGSVHRLCRNDPEFALRQLLRMSRRVHGAYNLGHAGEPQPLRVDRVDMVAREVVGPDLDIVELRQVCGEQGADGAASDNADPHA